jgi:diacylglycerol O-acyltransferase
MFWVPHPGPTVGLGVSLISYAGRVSIGVRADTGVVEDPNQLVDLLETSFDSLLA